MSIKEQVETLNYALDEKDRQILRLVQQDAKLSVREIATRINLSSTPTHERIKRMEAHGVIKEYVAVVDRRLVNKGLMVLVMVALSAHNKKMATQFIQRVEALPEVIEFHNISGDFDFVLKIVSSSMDDFHDFFVNRLSEIGGIGQTKSIFVMNTIKESHQFI
ncbi:Lrp/AsnC family transcriptional regulator [Sphingobacterium shayense]|uniref:Lrp/AsnC family transcriptional regulator n=1 Tax=Sphingobacterium shayense TaxID=626343 RepID=UPI00155579CC|nr:Lrp/AsnC family transcriptional regulator [Sphingobacterium shayense]NQD71758.1 Lrp/AsnC family transcriptional regulator [Sphingobacterium shayense]